jgi:hypothetical protein
VNGTMIVIGCEGYTCAAALAAIPKVAATAANTRTLFRICMIGTLGWTEIGSAACSMPGLIES